MTEEGGDDFVRQKFLIVEIFVFYFFKSLFLNLIYVPSFEHFCPSRRDWEGFKTKNNISILMNLMTSVYRI